MSGGSKLRAFAISVEQVVRLLPDCVSRKVLTQSEAEHLRQQLQSGAEHALDIALEIDGRA